MQYNNFEPSEEMLELLEFTLLPDGTYSVAGCDEEATEIVIPDMYQGKPVTAVAEAAFYEFWDLESVVLGKYVETIGDEAFSECGALRQLTVGPYVNEIGKGAFYGCSAIKSVNLDSKNSALRVENKCLIENRTGLLVRSFGTEAIPEGVKKIDYGACSHMGYTMIVFPSSLVEIGDHAFISCRQLSAVAIPDSVVKIGDAAFDITAIKSVSVPRGCKFTADGPCSHSFPKNCQITIR